MAAILIYAAAAIVAAATLAWAVRKGAPRRARRKALRQAKRPENQ